MNRISSRFAGQDVAASALDSSGARPRPIRPAVETVRHDSGEDNRSGIRPNFSDFSVSVHNELAPETVLEHILGERVSVAAWRLLEATAVEVAALEGAGLVRGKGTARRSQRTSAAAQRDVFRAERSLERALNLFELAKERRESSWGKAEHAASPVIEELTAAEPYPEAEILFESNEWTVVPVRDQFLDSDEEAEAPAEEETFARWQDRLVFDFNVSDTSPVIKGTWVTVGHVVSLIVDGWTWDDVLRTHPELTEEDVRTCLAYTVAQDNGADF